MSSDVNGDQPDRLNFFEEMERFASERDFRPFTFVLIDGSRFHVEYPEQIIAYSMMYVFQAKDGHEVMFPFPNLCYIEVHPQRDTHAHHAIP